MATMTEILGGRRASLVAERDALLAVEPDAFTSESEARATDINTELKELDARIADAREAEARDVEARKLATVTETPVVRAQVTSEANPVYRKGDSTGPSYFADLAASQRGDRDAIQRLGDSQVRALTTALGDGGEFAPPLWLTSDFIEMSRSGRVTADLVNHEVLPQGVSSVKVPKIATGTAVGITETQASAITQTDLTTTSVSSSIATITGGQTVAIELLRQSGIPLDSIILQDLALAYATGVDLQVLAGTNANGQLKGLYTAGTTLTFTTSAPAVISTTAAASFYNKVIKAQAAVATGRFLPADTVVMHPNRWAWVLEALDGQGRLQVTPNGPVLNAPAVGGAVTAEGLAGQLAGLPVFVDPNIATNLGVATNQDVVYVLRRGDHVLYETPVEAASFDATYAASNAVFFRVLGFAAFLTRHAASAQIIDGTGLTAPSL